MEKSVAALTPGNSANRVTPRGKTICEESEKICSRDPGTTFRLNLDTETARPFVYSTRSTLSLSLSPSLPVPLSVARTVKGWLLEKGLEVIAFPLTRVYRVAEDAQG